MAIVMVVMCVFMVFAHHPGFAGHRDAHHADAPQVQTDPVGTVEPGNSELRTPGREG